MHPCEHLGSDDVCGLASMMTGGVDVTTNTKACDACQRSDPPMALNRVTVSLAASHLRRNGQEEAGKRLVRKHHDLLQTSETKLPPVLQEAFSLAKAVGHFVVSPKTVSEDAYRERIAVCESCPSRSNHRCTICGCLIVFKTRLPAERCPIYSWEAVSDAVSETGV